MSDITKCAGQDCPLRETCYRYTAPSHEYRQSFFISEPIKDADGGAECKEWIDNGG